MNINELIAIIKKKLQKEILIESLVIEDKSFLHVKHSGNDPNKFHIKITIESDQLKKQSRLNSNKKIYKILDYEMKQFIHSLQILIV